MSVKFVYVPEDVLERLNEKLKSTPEKIPDALRKTINSAAKCGRQSVINRTHEEYTLKNAPRRIKAASEYESSRGKQLNATIVIKGRPEPLLNFSTRKNGKKVSAKAKVLQISQMKDLTLSADGKKLKAFIREIKVKNAQGEESSHVGVFRRMTEEERKGSSSQKRNAIKPLYSTSIPKMVENKEVYAKIEKDIKEELRRVLDKHIASVMEGMK